VKKRKYASRTLILSETLYAQVTDVGNGGKKQSLGKVRTEKVKKVARELVKRYPDKFTTDFENNKKVVMAHTQLTSLKMRNRIAGYISRLVAIQRALKGGGEETNEPEKTDEPVSADIAETEKKAKTE